MGNHMLDLFFRHQHFSITATSEMRVLMNQPTNGCLQHIAFFSNDWEIVQFFHDLNIFEVYGDKL
jgi:hypothetical protein